MKFCLFLDKVPGDLILCLKRIVKWSGRRVGWILREGWSAFKGIAKWFGILLLVIIGTLLALVGQVIVVILGGIVALCYAFLRVFAWITFKLMVTTKWFSSQVTDYTDSFFDSIKDTFSQEEDFLRREIHLTINLED